MQRERREAQEAVATAVPSLKRKNVPTNVSNPTAAQRQERNLDENASLPRSSVMNRLLAR